MMRKLLLTVSLSLLISAQADEIVSHEQPFNLIYQKTTQYTRNDVYVGSQILSGQLYYVGDGPFGDGFYFQVDDKDVPKLPVIVMHKGEPQQTTFVLNDLQDMNDEQLQSAAQALGIKTDLTSTSFRERMCGVEGPITLQASSINFFGVEDSEYNIDMRIVRVIDSGPFRIMCNES